MAKFMLKEIKEIQAMTPAELKGKQLTTDITDYVVVGDCSAPSWNWGYKVYAISYQGRPLLVVTQFGEVSPPRPLKISKNLRKESKNETKTI